MLARLPRSAAILLILVLLGIAAWFTLLPGAPVKMATKPAQYTDMKLYHDIVAEMVKGKPYHQAASELHRAHFYPLRPFFAMRPPTLAEAAAQFGWHNLQVAAFGLMLALVFVWAIATEGLLHWSERILVALAVATGGAAIANANLMAMHELWAGIFLSFALAVQVCWRKFWPLALLPLAAALAVRELALPFLLLAGAFALWERRWKEVAAYAALAALFAAFMAWHGHAALAVTSAKDIPSPGWNGVLGFTAFAKGVALTSVLQNLPLKLAMVLAVLPLVGWAALPGRSGLFAVLLFGGYAAMISLFARPDNFYWGMIVEPSYLIGFALLPRAAVQLWQAIHSPAR